MAVNIFGSGLFSIRFRSYGAGADFGDLLQRCCSYGANILFSAQCWRTGSLLIHLGRVSMNWRRRRKMTMTVSNR